MAWFMIFWRHDECPLVKKEPCVLFSLKNIDQFRKFSLIFNQITISLQSCIPCKIIDLIFHSINTQAIQTKRGQNLGEGTRALTLQKYQETRACVNPFSRKFQSIPSIHSYSWRSQDHIRFIFEAWDVLRFLLQTHDLHLSFKNSNF